MPVSSVTRIALTARLWVLGAVTLFVVIFANMSYWADSAVFNLEAVCVARSVITGVPNEACDMKLTDYLSRERFVLSATRLASLVALGSTENNLAQPLLQLDLDTKQLDSVTSSRVLLLRYLSGQTPGDLAAWRNSASSQIIVDIAPRIRVGNGTAMASELAYHLDDAWRDQWERGLNARAVGREFMEKGALADAAMAYERSIDSLARVEDGKRPALEYASYSYIRLGMIAELEGRLEDALDFYGNAILVSPQHADFYRPADLYLAQGRSLEDVEAYFTDLRQRGAQDEPHLWGQAAIVLLERGAPQAAERLLADVPDNLNASPIVRLAQARLAVAQGRWSDAEAMLAQLLSEEQISGNVDRIAYLTNLLGGAISKQGRLAESVALFKEATVLLPDTAQYWYDLGIAYQQIGQIADAQAALEKAISLRPSYAAALSALEELNP